MSRIDRVPIQNGQSITAADLNSRFGDFVQPGALNQFNTAEAAIDLPQLQTGWQAQYITEITLGQADLLMATPNIVAAVTAYPAGGQIVEDYGGTDSVMNFGLLGKTISNREVLRLYWSLTVSWDYSVSGGGPSSLWDITVTSTVSTTTLTSSLGGYVMYPEWDITSSALANFVPVPGQSDFQDGIDTYEGAALEDCMATTFIPAGWVQFSNDADEGITPAAGRVTSSLQRMGVSGAWHYSGEESGAVTVYGIRWRIIGLVHPYNSGGVNYLVVDLDSSGDHELLYSSGTAQAIIHRTR